MQIQGAKRSRPAFKNNSNEIIERCRDVTRPKNQLEQRSQQQQQEEEEEEEEEEGIIKRKR